MLLVKRQTFSKLKDAKHDGKNKVSVNLLQNLHLSIENFEISDKKYKISTIIQHHNKLFA